MRQLAFIVLLVLPFGFSARAFAQSGSESLYCYETLLREGNKFYKRKQFARAAAQFRTALESCDFLPADNRLDSLIQAAQRAEIAYLEAVRRRMREQLDTIQRLFEQEKEASQAAEAARQLAESNAALARRNEAIAIRNGRRAASLRLSTLADLEREEGNLSDAWQLSILSLHWSDSISYPSAMQAFTRIIVDSFATRLEMPAGIRKVQLRTEVIDVLTGDSVQRIGLLPGAPSPVLIAARELIAGSDAGLLLRQRDDYVWLYDELRRQERLSGNGAIQIAHFVRAGLELLTAGKDSTILHWRRGGPPNLLAAQTKGRNYDLVPINADKQIFATRSSAGVIEVWQIGQTAPLRTLVTNSAYTYDILSKQEFVIAAISTGEVLLFPPEAEQPLVRRHGSFAVAEIIDLGGSEELFLSRSIDGTMNIWNLTGELQTSIDPGTEVLGVRDRPERREFIVWTADRRISRWNYDGERIDDIRGFPSAILDVGVVPETDLLFVAGSGGDLTFWEGNTKVGELSVAASSNTLPVYSSSSRQIIWVSPAADQLVLMPLPQQHFAEYADQVDYSILPQHLAEKYRIESWDRE